MQSCRVSAKFPPQLHLKICSEAVDLTLFLLQVHIWFVFIWDLDQFRLKTPATLLAWLKLTWLKLVRLWKSCSLNVFVLLYTQWSRICRYELSNRWANFFHADWISWEWLPACSRETLCLLVRVLLAPASMLVYWLMKFSVRRRSLVWPLEPLLIEDKEEVAFSEVGVWSWQSWNVIKGMNSLLYYAVCCTYCLQMYWIKILVSKGMVHGIVTLLAFCRTCCLFNAMLCRAEGCSKGANEFIHLC